MFLLTQEDFNLLLHIRDRLDVMQSNIREIKVIMKQEREAVELQQTQEKPESSLGNFVEHVACVPRSKEFPEPLGTFVEQLVDSQPHEASYGNLGKSLANPKENRHQGVHIFRFKHSYHKARKKKSQGDLLQALKSDGMFNGSSGADRLVNMKAERAHLQVKRLLVRTSIHRGQKRVDGLDQNASVKEHISLLFVFDGNFGSGFRQQDPLNPCSHDDLMIMEPAQDHGNEMERVHIRESYTHPNHITRTIDREIMRTNMQISMKLNISEAEKDSQGGSTAEQVQLDWLVVFYGRDRIVDDVSLGVCNVIKEPIDLGRASRVWERGRLEVRQVLCDYRTHNLRLTYHGLENKEEMLSQFKKLHGRRRVNIQTMTGKPLYELSMANQIWEHGRLLVHSVQRDCVRKYYGRDRVLSLLQNTQWRSLEWVIKQDVKEFCLGSKKKVNRLKLPFRSGLANHVWKLGGNKSEQAQLDRFVIQRLLHKNYCLVIPARSSFIPKKAISDNLQVLSKVCYYSLSAIKKWLSCEYRKEKMWFVSYDSVLQAWSSTIELREKIPLVTFELKLRIMVCFRKFLKLCAKGIDATLVKRVKALLEIILGKRPRDPGWFDKQNQSRVQCVQVWLQSHAREDKVETREEESQPRGLSAEHFDYHLDQVWKLMRRLTKTGLGVQSRRMKTKYHFLGLRSQKVRPSIEELESCHVVCHSSESYKLMAINEETLSVVKKLCARSKSDIQKELDRNELVLRPAYGDEQRIGDVEVQRSPYLILICGYCKNQKSISKQMKYCMSFHLEDKMILSKAGKSKCGGLICDKQKKKLRCFSEGVSVIRLRFINLEEWCLKHSEVKREDQVLAFGMGWTIDNRVLPHVFVTFSGDKRPFDPGGADCVYELGRVWSLFEKPQGTSDMVITFSSVWQDRQQRPQYIKIDGTSALKGKRTKNMKPRINGGDANKEEFQSFIHRLGKGFKVFKTMLVNKMVMMKEPKTYYFPNQLAEFHTNGVFHSPRPPELSFCKVGSLFRYPTRLLVRGGCSDNKMRKKALGVLIEAKKDHTYRSLMHSLAVTDIVIMKVSLQVCGKWFSNYWITLGRTSMSRDKSVKCELCRLPTGFHLEDKVVLYGGGIVMTRILENWAWELKMKIEAHDNPLSPYLSIGQHIYSCAIVSYALVFSLCLSL